MKLARVLRNASRFSVGLVLLAGLLAAAPALHAEDTVLQFEAAQTHVNFTLGDVLHTVHGTFQLKRGTIRFDPTTGRAGGEVVIDAASGDSGSHARDSRMNKNVLESEHFPEIVFTADHVAGTVSADGPSQIQVHGLFKIHGVEHEIVLPVQAVMSHDQASITTAFPVPYVKWGMKDPSNFLLHVNDTVDISIKAVARIGTTSASVNGPRDAGGSSK